MHYWKALAFLRDQLVVAAPVPLSLDRLTQELGCTKRNAQLVVKKLVGNGIIRWQSSVGRGNFPIVTLLKDPQPMLENKARRWIEEGKVAMAISLIAPAQRDAFIAAYIARHQSHAHRDDILQIPFYRGTHALDPIDITRRTEQHLARYLYANLLRFDAQARGYRGDLAQTFQTTERGMAITLRKGLCFHNGEPLTAHSVQQHFTRLVTTSEHYRSLYQLIDAIEVQDRYRLEIISSVEATLLPKLLCAGAMGIALWLKGDADREGQVIGSGPFELVEQTEWRTLMNVSRYYHGYRPWVDGIEVWNVGDKAKEFAPNSHLFHPLLEPRAQAADYEQKAQWEAGCEYILLNANRSPWLGSLSRRKKLMAILDALGVPASFADEVTKAEGMLSSPSARLTANLHQAQQWADELGKPPQPLQLLTYALGQHIDYAHYLATTLRELGIACEVSVLPFPEFCQQATLQHADIILSGEVFGDDADMSWLGWLLASTSLQACMTPALQQWLHEALAAIYPLTEAKRFKAYQALEKKLIKKGLYLPRFHVQQTLSVAKSVSTSELLANGWVDFSEVVITP
ncbi:ABC transporter substrate-binding protein [Vibrio furnissii]|uniref:ABC transporter substrate-binding protein n=1 Tax=Vibrio furnissii TaxID=29494 RepID=UPI001E40EFD1|nr:ABC transporter substrate-binding protein [Vibrio furnissii]MCG6265997.1 ABC transporter substrate-binding protein [Vibrio furnissii]UHJ62405.1 ABC transporter substrate-binding protein [Vibrio furnissii]